MGKRMKAGKGRQKKHPISELELTRIKHRAVDEAFDKAFLVCCLALRDEFGFGEKRLVKFAERVDEVSDSVDKQYIRLREIQEAIEAETGLKFKGF